jgi:hypothetical protein
LATGWYTIIEDPNVDQVLKEEKAKAKEKRQKYFEAKYPRGRRHDDNIDLDSDGWARYRGCLALVSLTPTELKVPPGTLNAWRGVLALGSDTEWVELQEPTEWTSLPAEQRKKRLGKCLKKMI